MRYGLEGGVQEGKTISPACGIEIFVVLLFVYLLDTMHNTSVFKQASHKKL